ncbi:MAG TPA: protein kinase [Acidimicrobiales bacterium]|nr:protein kinase [Acidimicrobiales bacterium]
MTAALDDLVGKVLGGRYRLVTPIATGSSARVFLADDAILRRRVAVKVLHAALAADEVFLRRFRAEAQSVAALNHPHVMAVYDWGNDDVPYLVSEFLAGGSMRMMLDAGHRFTSSQALLVGLEAARGLEYAHKRGIIHRDVKPANLLFDEDGRLRLADFGLAKALSEAAWTEPSGVMLGTMRYASPEQAKGEALTGKSDLYSLALVLIEAVTGEVPFSTDTALGTLMARVDNQLHAPSELGALGPAIERAAHPDPAQRPDAGEFSIALMAAAEDLVRPEPLPLVSSISRGDPIDADRDPTLIAPAEIRRPDPETADLAVVEDRSRAMLPERRPTVPAVPRATSSRPSPYDRFADTRPPRRWPIAVGVAIVMIFALGALGVAMAGRASTHEVPDLRNEPESKLLDLAAANGWRTARVDLRDNDVAAGNIIETDPVPGQSLEKGELLTYTLSRGKPLVAVPPDLVGKAAAEGRELLIQAGFTVTEPQVVFDEQAPKGTIMQIVDEANKPATSEAPKGSTLTFVVSNGPDQRVVPPGLENQPKDAVVNALTALRLNPQLKEEFHETVPKDMVISVDPPVGTKLDVDALVTVSVSKGQEPRLVPNTVGMTLQQATTALEANLFKIKGVTGSPSRTVLITDPPAGERHPVGTLVQIIMRSN